ncbi:MAG: protein kinase [Proteobacteria bacterium]|nr:protein kinase [Pseudomonadota bacterium]
MSRKTSNRTAGDSVADPGPSNEPGQVPWSRDDGGRVMAHGAAEKYGLSETHSSERVASTAGQGNGRGLSGPPTAGMFVNQYELIRELGRGGMGTVFLARDTWLGRRVAIKFLSRASEGFADPLVAEARATAQCRHENIVVIYEVGEYGGRPYMALEYLQGQNLRVWLARRKAVDGARLPGHTAREPIGPPGREYPAEFSPSGAVGQTTIRSVPVSLAVDLIAPVVRALVCAHEHKIVHRDLKPENIVLCQNGVTKVLDFGLATRFAGDEFLDSMEMDRLPITDPGSPGLVGTLQYMAPEQRTGGEPDPRNDLWAVGIMLYEMVTGHHPLAPLSKRALMQVAELDLPMPQLSERLPGHDTFTAIVDGLLRKPLAERIGSASELLARLEPLLPGRRMVELSRDERPFTGLAAFQEADASRFFGRDSDINSVVNLLHNQVRVTIAGPSGAGKSSLVRAGLIPALKHSDDGWEAFVIRPGRQPMAALAELLGQVAGESAASLHPTDDDGAAPTPAQPHHRRASRTRSPRNTRPDNSSASHFPPGRAGLIATLHRQPGYLGVALRARARHLRRRILLFVDQFEELYTLVAGAGERAAFVACLDGAADDAASPLRLVVALRSDFVDRLAEERSIMGEIMSGLCFLPPVEPDGLRDALIRPVEAAGYRFESAEMVTEMLEELRATRVPLPLLQFTAAMLWARRDRDSKVLTGDSSRQLGGVVGALSTHADAVLASLSAREYGLARAVLVRLVTPERTRAIVSMNELRDLVGQEPDDKPDGDKPDDEPDRQFYQGQAVEQVIQHLAGARLIIIESSAGNGVATVELVHESLIDRWSTLGQWLDESKDDAHFVARVRAAAEQWQAGGRSEELLWRGQFARDVRDWLQRQAETDSVSRTTLSRRERLYLAAVVNLAERAKQQRQRITFCIGVTSIILIVLVSLLALQARREAARAEDESIQARNASRMASAREHQADPTLVLALVREMEPAAQLPQRWRELAHWAMHQPIARAVFTHPNEVYSVAYSPDGTRIVTASAKTVRVRKADGTGRPIVLSGHQSAVISAAFSPDGTRIVSASSDRTARVWKADGTGQPLELIGHQGAVFDAAFSPDGTHIATASWDRTARLWKADGTGRPIVLTGHRDRVISLAFSPDGTRIVTTSSDTTARVWRVDGSGQPIVLEGHQDRVVAAAFSPDGTRVATASYDKTVRVWKADGTGRPVVLTGHQDEVLSASFSPDGARIATGSRDKTLRVSKADGTGRPMVLTGHQDRINSVAFSPDGTRIVTASGDKTARVWKADGTGQPIVLAGHQGRVYAAGFSPDGTRVVTGSRDRTARVWNADGSGRPIVFTGHQKLLYSAGFSPDGTRIVTSSWDRTARVWNADGSGQPIVLTGHRNFLSSAVFSPDGKRVVTSSWDRTARVWNADGTGRAIVLTGHQDGVNVAVFSPDGTHIVTTSTDETVRVWKADGSGQPLVLTGHDARISAGTRSGKGVFSPDGSRIVTISDDKTMRVWNADGTGQPVILRMPDTDASSVAFSPDGTRIVTSSHSERNPATGELEHWATVWPSLERFTGLSDPALWTATTYCPPVELRVELLGVSRDMATRHLEQCRARVASAASLVPDPDS